MLTGVRPRRSPPRPRKQMSIDRNAGEQTIRAMRCRSRSVGAAMKGSIFEETSTGNKISRISVPTLRMYYHQDPDDN